MCEVAPVSCQGKGVSYSERMTKNPYINASLAAAYIALVATVMTVGEKFGPDGSILVPMAVLSLFVLSACVMGFIFFFEPVQMYLDGAKKEAISLAYKTIGTFAVITALFFATLLFVA
ncbi:MAG: Uncharacterized protein G01um10148_522 [Parcubacteria group bacterium Gr01-1014_8]|nr:MAG: Uncharacterized protein G01um10148_522 [Parcubacteria group bacterium Gr01-1014_8]